MELQVLGRELESLGRDVARDEGQAPKRQCRAEPDGQRHGDGARPGGDFPRDHRLGVSRQPLRDLDHGRLGEELRLGPRDQGARIGPDAE